MTALASLPHPPLANHVGAWWAALCSLDTSLTYPYLMGMTGGAARIVWCGDHCLALARREAMLWTIPSLERMGYLVRRVNTSVPSNETLRKRLTRSLMRGAPVVWFQSDREGVLIGPDAGTSGFLARGVTDEGLPCTYPMSADELRTGSVFIISRSRRPKGPRRLREAQALVFWAAHALRPALKGLCVNHPVPTWCGIGLSAREIGQAALRKPANQMIARWWEDADQAAAACLWELAGHRRTPFAVRLRRAAQAHEDGRQEEAIHHALEAAFVGLDLPIPWRHVLLDPPETPLHGTNTQEMIYLARAGMYPLRQLAARRLVGTNDPQAVATLGQLLHDPDGPTSEAALWALVRIEPTGLPGILADAFRNVPREGRQASSPLQRPLLFAVAETGDRSALHAVLQSLEAMSADDPERMIMLRWLRELRLG